MQYLPPPQIFLLAFYFFLLISTGCGSVQPAPPSDDHGQAKLLSFDKPPSLPEIMNGDYTPATQEQAQEQLRGSVRGWFFGPGLGRTMLNVGTVVLFPPYALYLVGNAGIALAGYEPVYFTDALPESPRKHVLDTYHGVTGVPGHLTALVAGEEYSDTR